MTTSSSTSLEQSLYGLQIACVHGDYAPNIIRSIASAYDISVDDARLNVRNTLRAHEIYDDAPWTQWLDDDEEWAAFKQKHAAALGLNRETPYDTLR